MPENLNFFAIVLFRYRNTSEDGLYNDQKGMIIGRVGQEVKKTVVSKLFRFISFYVMNNECNT